MLLTTTLSAVNKGFLIILLFFPWISFSLFTFLYDPFYLFLNVSFLEESEILLSIFVPIMIYSNPGTEKSNILSDLKGKTGIYMWTHNSTGKRYIGSAFYLSKRLSNYYISSELKRMQNYISNAIISYTHEAFTLSILEFIDIPNLDKKEARELILGREQYYLDFIFKEAEPISYNILKVAGFSLGFTQFIYHRRALRSLGKLGKNNPNFGRSFSAETKSLMSEAHKGKLLNIPLTEGHKLKISEAKKVKHILLI